MTFNFYFQNSQFYNFSQILLCGLITVIIAKTGAFQLISRILSRKKKVNGGHVISIYVTYHHPRDWVDLCIRILKPLFTFEQNFIGLQS